MCERHPKEGQRSHRGPLLLSSGSSYSMARFLLCCRPLSSVEAFSCAASKHSAPASNETGGKVMLVPG
jgi:hypothetical protein